MTVRCVLDNDQLQVIDEEKSLRAKHVSQLRFWGFCPSDSHTFVQSATAADDLLTKLTRYLDKHGIAYSLDDKLSSLASAVREKEGALAEAKEAGARVKNGDIDTTHASSFLKYIEDELPRHLKPHQIKAAIHLLSVVNGANFSVPGSGKTAVVLAVYGWMKKEGMVDALFVAGPPSCFGPWRHEYEQTLGAIPKHEILAGGDINDRHGKYYVPREQLADLYLTSFHTLHRDHEKAKILINQKGVRFFLVIDEAHYVKQLGGEWASAVLQLAPCATVRCVLTGTPFPRSYTDAFNLFDILWPHSTPLPDDRRVAVEYHIQKRQQQDAAQVLDAAIGPLFYRVRKQDLGLAPQDIRPPVIIPMKPHERRVYDTIIDRIRGLSKDDLFRDLDLALRLRRGRMIRLRQTVSYTKLLGAAVTDYSEDLVEGDVSLADLIRHYDELETPGKVEYLLSLLSSLRNDGEKAVVWSNFIDTLKMLKDQCAQHGWRCELIYGATPVESRTLTEEATREEIIAEFIDPDSGLDILIANPAACAESISLHTTCSHAIYYDLSYNCAQFLQSMDRIHRVGGSETKVSHYHFLQYDDTVDADILSNVHHKASDMSAIVDKDYPIYSLDMFGEDEEQEAYDRLFGKKE